jgi:hypothetical protein
MIGYSTLFRAAHNLHPNTIICLSFWQSMYPKIVHLFSKFALSTSGYELVERKELEDEAEALRVCDYFYMMSNGMLRVT